MNDRDRITVTATHPLPPEVTEITISQPLYVRRAWNTALEREFERQRPRVRAMRELLCAYWSTWSMARFYTELRALKETR
jgi:hypothetical protein